MLNRAVLLNKLNDDMQIDPSRTALVAIDMHRGHLDPQVATKPVDAAWAGDVLRHTAQLIEMARKSRMSIIHVVVENRFIPGVGREGLTNPRIQAVRQARLSLGIKDAEDTDNHNLEGSVQAEIMPEVAPQEGDYVIRTKRRLSVFYGTDLELLLRALKVDTLLLVGINTNTCVQGAAFEAHNRDYRAVVVADCVASMYGQDLHNFALKNISHSFGWVLTLEELQRKFGPVSQEV